jgi:predicted acetyltransferase
VTAGGLEIRPFGPGDDIEAELDLRRRAFGPIAAAARPGWVASIQGSIDAGQLLGAFDGTRLVASARYHAMRQWWHGRSMPMAGVAGVKVAPEERGRGLGRALMTRLLADIESRGYPVSALYPSTMPLYRSLGWEITGGLYETVVPARSLAPLAAEDPDVAPDPAGPAPGVRRAAAGDAATVIEVLGRVHRALRHCGPNTREPAEAAAWLADEDHFAYLAEDGFLSYRWAKGTSELAVYMLQAASAGTARAFWQILASHASMARTVRACLAPSDPVTWLTREPDARTRSVDSWMLRLVNPAEAIAARGYPSAALLSVQLELYDPVLPGNCGRWALEVSGGTGQLARASDQAAGRGAVLRLGARGLAALFGGTPTATLRVSGLMSGGEPATDEALDCAFAGAAFMVDNY